MNIFVTGGTGYIGERLVAGLLKRGDRVYLLCRSGKSRQIPENENLQVHVGDILDASSLAIGMKECEAVIHLAAYAKNWSPKASMFDDVNVTGTRNVFERALEQKVQKIIWTSSLVVLGPSNSSTLDEETNRQVDFFTEYERSKFIAEEMGRELVKQGLPLVTVYPTRVYGPGKDTEGNSVTRLLRLYVRRRLPFLLHAGREVGNYVYVDDLVTGIILALDRGKVGGRYILGGENVSLREFFDLVDDITGQRHLRIPLPSFVARWIAQVAEMNAKLFGIYPLITPGWLETFLRDWAATPSLAVRELGYRVTPLREGLETTLRWLARQGALK